MSEVEGWIYFDGPEPEHLRPLLDALRDLPPATAEDKERVARRFFEKLDAALSHRGEPSVVTGAPLAPSLPVEAREARPAVGRPAENLTTTVIALEIPAEVREKLGRLPFKPMAAGQELARTLQVPVMNLRQGETVPLGDDSIAKAVAALPFAGTTVGGGVVSFPSLKVEEVASLWAELSVWPERAAEILPRYQVMNEVAYRALEEHWQRQLSASAEVRARFEKAIGEYTAWLRTRRG